MLTDRVANLARACKGCVCPLTTTVQQNMHAGTPNGWKISILLRELEHKHDVQPISLSKSEQKEPAFLKINPNARIPAIGARPICHTCHAASMLSRLKYRHSHRLSTLRHAAAVLCS